jgi:hypothetical protein
MGKKELNLRDHLNLIRNHGYQGGIAVFTGPNQLSIQNGDLILVQERTPTTDSLTREQIKWRETHRTVEMPLSQEDIDQRTKRGERFSKTFNTCVAIPIDCLEEIIV